jgi:hypothetical protein
MGRIGRGVDAAGRPSTGCGRFDRGLLAGFRVEAGVSFEEWEAL